MNLSLLDNAINEAKNNKTVQSFIKELQNYLEKNNSKDNYKNIQEGDVQLESPEYKGNKIITKYRDQMYIERNNILNNYARETLDKGQMYYIYSKSIGAENCYNVCICEEGQSHTVIKLEQKDLPKGAEVGSVLRKSNETYQLDQEATEIISKKIDIMKDTLLQEQNEYLKSQRIEGHIYEMSEKEDDRAWLFDNTNTDSSIQEAIEEINFPKELLENAQEVDLFIYQNGEYKPYNM